MWNSDYILEEGMAYEEEVVYGLDAAPYAVGAGAVELDGGEAKRLGLFMEVLM